MKKISLLIEIFVVIKLLWTTPVFAQSTAKTPNDKVVYVLTKAIKEPKHPTDNPLENKIDIAFGKSFPDCNDKKEKTKGSSSAVENVDNWAIIIEALPNAKNEAPGTKTVLIPESAMVDRSCDNKLVILTMRDKIDDSPDAKFDAKTHKITIIYKQGNYPDVRFGQFEDEERKNEMFAAAKGKEDADIYFFGSATGAQKSKPNYSIVAKLGYFWDFETKGALGPKVTFDSEEGSEVDPNSITAKLAYENIFVLGSARYLFMNFNPVGGELDKKSNTRNFIATFDVRYAPPSFFFSKTNIGAMDFTFGVEGGHNFKNVLSPDGFGTIWRWKLGASVYFVALAPGKFKRINFITDYLVRLPHTGEPFSEKINGTDVLSSTKRPRHNIGTDLEFMFSDAFGLTIKYQFGSLPPTFKLINHKISAGFTVKLKQNR